MLHVRITLVPCVRILQSWLVTIQALSRASKEAYCVPKRFAVGVHLFICNLFNDAFSVRLYRVECKDDMRNMDSKVCGRKRL
jgi:hypothetical protein